MPYHRSATRRIRLRSVLALERAMRARDMNASELAAATKSSPQTISNLRRGTQTHTREPLARAIARALRTDLTDLFDVSVEEHQESA